MGVSNTACNTIPPLECQIVNSYSTPTLPFVRDWDCYGCLRCVTSLWSFNCYWEARVGGGHVAPHDGNPDPAVSSTAQVQPQTPVQMIHCWRLIFLSNQILWRETKQWCIETCHVQTILWDAYLFRGVLFSTCTNRNRWTLKNVN